MLNTIEIEVHVEQSQMSQELYKTFHQILTTVYTRRGGTERLNFDDIIMLYICYAIGYSAHSLLGLFIGHAFTLVLRYLFRPELAIFTTIENLLPYL